MGAYGDRITLGTNVTSLKLMLPSNRLSSPANRDKSVDFPAPSSPIIL